MNVRVVFAPVITRRTGTIFGATVDLTTEHGKPTRLAFIQSADVDAPTRAEAHALARKDCERRVAEFLTGLGVVVAAKVDELTPKKETQPA